MNIASIKKISYSIERINSIYYRWRKVDGFSSHHQDIEMQDLTVRMITRIA